MVSDSDLLPDAVVLTELGSSEVERMSGVSASIQRVWRNRGFLPPLTGTRAVFNIFDAAAIAIRHRLTLQGHSPAETFEVGARYAAYLVYFALMDTSGICEVLAASSDKLDAVEARFWADEAIIAQATGLAPKLEPDRFLIGSEKGREIVAAGDLLECQERLQTPSGVFIDLQLLADRFGLQAERPLVTFLYDGVTRTSSPPPRRRIISRRRAS